MDRAAIDHEVTLPGRGRTVVRDIPGPAGAPAVLLLHGLGATGRLTFGPCFRPLSERFRVLCVDHRGHGRGLPTRRFRLEECADDAAAAAAARGVQRFVAVGYSMGGPIAALLWRRHPERVSGLVLCATARHFLPRRAARMARAFLPVAVGLARLAPGRARERLLGRMLARIEHPELRERAERELAGHDAASILQATRAISAFASHDWIGDVRVPTAVLVTTRDELVPPVRQRKLAASIPGAEILEVDGDHDACLVGADRFVPALVEACTRVARRAGEGAAPGAPRKERPMHCPGCGSALEGHSCKLRCPRCGYFESCSDLEPHPPVRSARKAGTRREDERPKER